MRRWTVLPMFALTAALAGVSSVAAQDHCTGVPPGQVRVNLPGGSESSLDIRSDGQIVLHIGATEDPCDASRDSTTLVRVEVSGQDGNETFVVDNNGPGGVFSQQFNVDLGQGENTVGVRGTDGNDRVTATTDTDPVTNEATQFMEMQMYDAQLKQQEASEINIESIGDLIVLFFGGLDIFGVAGITVQQSPTRAVRSSAAPLAVPVIVDGGSGNDRLTGGTANDGLVGGKGNDKLVGGKGKDVLVGGKGEDTCKGGPGKDKEKGCE